MSSYLSVGRLNLALGSAVVNAYLSLGRQFRDLESDMSENSKEAILAAARRTAQAHGYGGLNFRDLAAEVGIKAASIYHYFPGKADLGAAVARRYWQDTSAALDALASEAADPIDALRRYPATFRTALTTGNRICLCSYMAAEYDDLPD